LIPLLNLFGLKQMSNRLVEKWRKWFKVEKYRELFKLDPPKGFEEWCQTEFEPLTPGKTIKASEFFHDNEGRSPPHIPTSENFRKKIIEEEEKKIIEEGEKEPINLYLDGNFELSPFKFSGEIKFSKITPELRCHIHTLSIHQRGGHIVFEGAIIRQVFFTTVSSSANVAFKNCCIQSIKTSPEIVIELQLDNCVLGTLELGRKAIFNLTTQNGWICNINSPPPDGDNPFSGSVTFFKTRFPTSTRYSSLFKGPQQYRNLRAHLEKLQNAPAAMLMRSKELAAERENDYGVAKLFSLTYSLISNYGLSPGRPLLFAILLNLITAVLLFKVDGGALGLPEESYKGWKSIFLMEGNNIPEVYRSIFLTVQSVINPLGLFLANKIIIAKNHWMEIWLGIQGLLTDGFLLFLVFGIRKRFKLL
jgi:hypothetical protein